MTLILRGIPTPVGEKLIGEFLEIKKRFAMNDWGPGQLMGGRFAEAMLRVYQHLLGETLTPFGTDISAAQKTRIMNAVQSSAAVDNQFRQKAVPLTRLLLDFRNNRDVAHLGGFDANSMDTLFVMTSATWMLCELVRVYGGYPMRDAQKIVDGLAVKEYPVITERNGELFIARHNLSAKEEVLVLLTKNDSSTIEFLNAKTGDSNSSRFRRNLREMVSDKLIGIDANGEYFIMPRGRALVTKKSLLSYSP